MEEVKKGNIKELVDIINRTNDTFAYSVFIPSLSREVLFREITTAQQKKLVKSVIDSPVFNTEFIFTLREIIRENCTEPSLNIDDLTIYDKLIIAITMRIMSISNDLNVNLTCEKCKNTQTLNIKLDKLLEIFKNLNTIKYEDVIVDDNKAFKVYCKIPSIGTEYNLENEFRKNTKLNIENEKELRETLGNVFISEIVKFITKIEVLDTETSNTIEINLQDLSFANRIKIIEKLNSKLIQKIIQFISDIKKNFEKVTLVKTKCNCDNNVELTQRFSIDSNFFIPS